MAEKKVVVKKAKKTFALLNGNGDEIGRYTGAAARAAALKAANDGHKDIVLREKKSKTLHYFKGMVTLVAPPKNAPAFILESAKKSGGKIKKSNVEKVGTARLQHNQLAHNPKELFKMPAPKAPKAAKPKAAAAKPAKK